MLCVEDDVILAPVLDDENDHVLPDKGRVWRRRNKSVCKRNSKDGPVLRATVKPVKRFRPDSTPPNVPSTSSIPIVPVNPAPQTIKLDLPVQVEEPSTPEFKSKKTNQSPQQTKPPNSTKKKRVREQWSIEDKDHFFDAVAIHGKDFEAIQKTIATKHKKKGDESAVKTKDQVRHLYYRTWTTINKLLINGGCTTTDSKAIHELCAVINYGELRRKLGGSLIKKKGILKLNELIKYGSTTIRVKGKNYKIKTPACKALKRIHDKEVNKQSISETKTLKLPLRVNLEISPLSMSAWNRVHSLAHNPRLRFSIPLDCQVTSLISYLTKKWRPLNEKMFEVAESGDLIPNNITCNPGGCDSNDYNSNLNLEIHFPPGTVAKSKIEVHQVVLSKTHCIVSYICRKTSKSNTNKRKKNPEAHIHNDQNFAADSCPSSEEDCGNIDPLFETEEISINNINDIEDKLDNDFNIPPAKKLFNAEIEDNHLFTDEFQSEFDIGALVDSADSCASNDSNPSPVTELQLDQVQDDPTETFAPITNPTEMNVNQHGEIELIEAQPLQPIAVLEDKFCEKKINEKLKNVERSPENNKDTVETKSLCKSWNPETAGETTLAELYIMLGKPNSFKLCYDWIQKTLPDDTTPSCEKVGFCTGITALLQAAEILRNKRMNSVSTKDKEKTKPDKMLPNNKLISKPEKSNVGVQCSLLTVPTTPTVSTVVPNKNHHGRGMSKFTTSLNSLDGSSQFVIPTAPISKKRKTINLSSISLDASPSPEEIKQRVQERAGDAQFRKQMEALNRRKDMFRINNHRNTRKPYIVQRAITPHAGSVRKMMTLGIVSSGDNQIGFIPTETVSTANSTFKALTKTPIYENLKTSNSASPVFGEALGIKILNPNHKKPNSLNNNVLERAAHEAGLNFPQIQPLPSQDTNIELPLIENKKPDDFAMSTTLPPISTVFAESVNRNATINNDELPELDVRQSELMNLNIRPPTPSMDSLLNALDIINPDSNDSFAATLLQKHYCRLDQPNEMPVASEFLPLNMPILNTPQKSRSSSPQWDEESVDGDNRNNFVTLDTPQRVLQSDNEDSIDGLMFAQAKGSKFGNSIGSPFPTSLLNDSDFHIPSLINDNSMDLISKFQDILHQQTSVDNVTTSVSNNIGT